MGVDGVQLGAVLFQLFQLISDTVVKPLHQQQPTHTHTHTLVKWVVAVMIDSYVEVGGTCVDGQLSVLRTRVADIPASTEKLDALLSANSPETHETKESY